VRPVRTRTRQLRSTLAVLTVGASLLLAGGPSAVVAQTPPPESTHSYPPDISDYTRAITPDDLQPVVDRASSAALAPGTDPGGVATAPSTAAGGEHHADSDTRLLLRDVVVSNTDPTLTNTDTFNDGEPSIAINRANHREIVISAFSGAWGAFAPIWHSLDGGSTWTKQFIIPAPPGVLASGCPCDQTFDYGRQNPLSGAFLTVPTNVYSGTTINPGSAADWRWFVVNGVTQRTNRVATNIADQPWLLVNRDPTQRRQDDIYVAYDDFSGGPNMRVAVARGSFPPDFTVDTQSGTSTGLINPGHRLAADPRNGVMYSLFQRATGFGAGGSKNIDYMLNRSTDGGTSWSLNGNTGGVVVANADSTQPQPKFGTVNALLGGVLHAAVDPRNGDVYYVFGDRDPGTGNNRLALARLQSDEHGTIRVADTTFVTGQVQAALPSVAVTSDGHVGVLYDTFDGFSTSGFPIFTAHLASSVNRGASFTDRRLLTFASAAKDNGNPRQRVFGDYQQLKALGPTLYGTFTANGAGLGRPFANHDAIFFRLGPADEANAEEDG
jgi:hypothetical protein